MYDIIVIGAGPSGMTAALYGLRANKSVLVLESISHGGQIINASNIENYPGIINISGFDYANNLYNQVIDLGGVFKYENVVSIDSNKKIITNKNEYEAKTIIIATGCKNRKLNLADEDKYIGKGLSYCATCDGNFYKDKVVCVVGGGNTALEDALYLSNIASKVYLIHRRDKFRGDNKYVEEVKSKSNIEIILNASLNSLNGDLSVSSVDLLVDGNIKSLSVDGVFVAIGQIPNSDFLKNIIDLDDNGYINSSDCHTNIKGIYVAGDVRSKNVRQLTTAVSDGTISATLAVNEMEE